MNKANQDNLPTNQKDFIILKYGLLKWWKLSDAKSRALLKEYLAEITTNSLILQDSTPAMKELACQIIDSANVDKILIDSLDEGKLVSKKKAKKYIKEY